MNKFEVVGSFERSQGHVKQVEQVGYAVTFDTAVVRRGFPLNSKGLADANYLARSLNNVMEKLA